MRTGEKSEATQQLRKEIKDSCEQLILDFFGDEERGQVAIYDANNGTKASRKALGDKFEKEGVHVIFLGTYFTSLVRYTSSSLLVSESICTNQEIVLANVRNVKITSPDYKGLEPEKAVEDYMNRIRDHERYYEPVDEPDWPWIRIINVLFILSE